MSQELTHWAKLKSPSPLWGHLWTASMIGWRIPVQLEEAPQWEAETGKNTYTWHTASIQFVPEPQRRQIAVGVRQRRSWTNRQKSNDEGSHLLSCIILALLWKLRGCPLKDFSSSLDFKKTMILFSKVGICLKEKVCLILDVLILSSCRASKKCSAQRQMTMPGAQKKSWAEDLDFGHQHLEIKSLSMDKVNQRICSQKRDSKI